jgi:outer membrane protein OmpA-like peptidoglycan-associated protein
MSDAKLGLKLGLGLVALTLLVSGCATSPPKSEAIVVGDDICAGEATRIYFPHGESVLGPLAAQVVVRVQDQLAQCPKRRIILVSISGDDGPPSTLENREERAAIVRQILVSRGVAESRITATAQGPMVDQAPKGPIGGVLIFTRP